MLLLLSLLLCRDDLFFDAAPCIEEFNIEFMTVRLMTVRFMTVRFVTNIVYVLKSST